MIWLSKEYTISSEEPAGFGRADVMIIPHDKSKRGIILEFNKAGKKRKTTLEEAAQAAKDQMIEKKYRRRMEAHGVSLITMIAIGFKGQECLVVEVE